MSDRDRRVFVITGAVIILMLPFIILFPFWVIGKLSEDIMVIPANLFAGACVLMFWFPIELIFEIFESFEVAYKLRINRLEGKLAEERSRTFFIMERLSPEQRRYVYEAFAEGSHTEQDWEDLKKHYNYTCLRCGRREPEITLTKDHVIPLSYRGSNYIHNIQPLCGSCNSGKGAKHIDYRKGVDNESVR